MRLPIVEHNGKRVLFDPWLDEGIFHGAWFYFPPPVLDIKDLGHLDYVYISHIHEDHCSAGTIKHINPDAEIILMDRTPNLVLNFLQNNNFNFKKVHLVKPRSPVELEPGLIVDIVEANPEDEMARIIDSSIVMNWDGFTLYNANDCQPHNSGISYIKSTYGTLDLALLPYTGGSGYPGCYTNLTNEEKLVEKERIIESRINSFIESTRQLNPIRVLPFADEWCVGGSRSHLNEYVAHAPCKGSVEEIFTNANLDSELLLLNSGQQYDFKTNTKIPDEPYIHFSDNDRDKHIEQNLIKVEYDHEKFSFEPSVSLNRLMQYARKRQWDMQTRLKYFPDFNFYFDSVDTKERFCIDASSENIIVTDTSSELVEPYLKISVSRDLLIMLLIGHIS